MEGQSAVVGNKELMIISDAVHTDLYDDKDNRIPYATSGGSSIKKACEDLKATYPDVNWKEGKLLNRTTKKDLENWVKK